MHGTLTHQKEGTFLWQTDGPDYNHPAVLKPTALPINRRLQQVEDVIKTIRDVIDKLQEAESKAIT
jgi:hypothetical protein